MSIRLSFPLTSSLATYFYLSTYLSTCLFHLHIHPFVRELTHSLNLRVLSINYSRYHQLFAKSPNERILVARIIWTPFTILVFYRSMGKPSNRETFDFWTFNFGVSIVKLCKLQCFTYLIIIYVAACRPLLILLSSTSPAPFFSFFIYFINVVVATVCDNVKTLNTAIFDFALRICSISCLPDGHSTCKVTMMYF